MNAQVELPKYRSHKTVHALKLRLVVEGEAEMTFTPEDATYAPITVSTKAEVAKRCRAREMNDAGYYVVYPDGFVSWSPTKAFEDGYTAL